MKRKTAIPWRPAAISPVVMTVALLLLAAPSLAQLPEVSPRPADATKTESAEKPARDVELPDVDARETLPEDEAEFEANEVFLGIAVAPSEDKGVYVSEVALNGPADKAGIQTGDFILSVNETGVDSLQRFQAVLAKLKPGTQGKIVVLRGDQTLELPIEYVSHETAGFRPDESGKYGLVEVNPPKACLGVMLIDDSPETEGVTIQRVHPDCPAASEAGLEEGDIIYSVNETEVSTPADVTRLLSELEPGAKITLLVRRDGERQLVTTTLADREKLESVNTRSDTQDGSPDLATEHQLMLEQHRHFARQHERLEDLSLQLLDEVKALRKEVRDLKNGQTGGN